MRSKSSHWRQGSMLPAEHSLHLLYSPELGPSGKLMLITHDCDIDNPKVEKGLGRPTPAYLRFGRRQSRPPTHVSDIAMQAICAFRGGPHAGEFTPTNLERYNLLGLWPSTCSKDLKHLCKSGMHIIVLQVKAAQRFSSSLEGRTINPRANNRFLPCAAISPRASRL